MQQTVRDIMSDYKKVPVSMRASSINDLYILRFLQNIAATLERIEKQGEASGKARLYSNR